MPGKKFQCPHCDKWIVRYVPINGEPPLLKMMERKSNEPEPGDVGVCTGCGGWWTMNKKRLLIRYRPTAHERTTAQLFVLLE